MQTRDNRITNKLVKQGKLPKSQLEIYPQKTASKSAGFSPQQIRAIKQSPKGKLPSFILKSYSDSTVNSVAGRVGSVGGTVGYDKKAKRPFGSMNYKGKVKAQFGPQE